MIIKKWLAFRSGIKTTSKGYLQTALLDIYYIWRQENEKETATNQGAERVQKAPFAPLSGLHQHPKICYVSGKIFSEGGIRMIEFFHLLYVSLTGGFIMAGGVVVLFLIRTEKIHRLEDKIK